MRDENGTVAILPRVRGTDLRPESALRAEKGRMIQFQAIIDSIDMNDIHVWQGEPTEPEIVEGSLVSGVPQVDAESVRQMYEEIIDDPTVHAVLSSEMTADNISQVAALNGTVSGSSA